MPVYNGRRHVAAAVESILAQRFRNFEFIIVDDGSTDGSSAILEQHAKLDARIRLSRVPNGGVVKARTLGLEMARAHLVAAMDADDLADPRRFDLQLEYMRQHPEVVVVGSSARMIDEEGAALGIASQPLEHEEIEASHLRGYDRIFQSAAMFRLEAAQRVGGYRPSIMPGEDFDLWLRLGEVGRLGNLPEPLLHWRRTMGGLSYSTAQQKHEAMVERILRDAWQRRGLSGEPVIPPAVAASRADICIDFGWMALRNGHRRTALKYAFRRLREKPFSLASWRLAGCAVRGR